MPADTSSPTEKAPCSCCTDEPRPPPPTPSPSDWFLLHTRMLMIHTPEIYRQLLVPPSITPPELSTLLISAFGWANGHQHEWSVRKVTETDCHSFNYKSELNPYGNKIPIAGVEQQRVDIKSDQDDTTLWRGLSDIVTLSELDEEYDISGHKHVLQYEYDLGDSWKHAVFIERRVSEEEVLELEVMKEASKPKGKKRMSSGKEKAREEEEAVRAMPKIIAGSGHGVAEDCGGLDGWEDLKDAYKLKGTKGYEEGDEVIDWYENQGDDGCMNGDPKGLKGKKRLEYFDVKEASLIYEEMVKGGW